MSNDQLLAMFRESLAEVRTDVKSLDAKVDGLIEMKAHEMGQRKVWMGIWTFTSGIIGALVTTFFTKGKP